jgi:hypothetical protein
MKYNISSMKWCKKIISLIRSDELERLLNKRWWHRLFKVLFWTSFAFLILTIFSSGLEGYSRSKQTHYVYSFEPAYYSRNEESQPLKTSHSRYNIRVIEKIHKLLREKKSGESIPVEAEDVVNLYEELLITIYEGWIKGGLVYGYDPKTVDDYMKDSLSTSAVLYLTNKGKFNDFLYESRIKEKSWQSPEYLIPLVDFLYMSLLLPLYFLFALLIYYKIFIYIAYGRNIPRKK